MTAPADASAPPGRSSFSSAFFVLPASVPACLHAHSWAPLPTWVVTVWSHATLSSADGRCHMARPPIWTGSALLHVLLSWLGEALK